ncbi:MAG: hypothetical protein JSR33_05525 [Proteobacteria bacterium]|nr:hypothetical protein [Pseudomonadota bacterium]
MHGGPTINLNQLDPEVSLLFRRLESPHCVHENIETSLKSVSGQKFLSRLRDEKNRSIIAIVAQSESKDKSTSLQKVLHYLQDEKGCDDLIWEELKEEIKSGKTDLLQSAISYYSKPPMNLLRLKNLITKPDSCNQTCIDIAIAQSNNSALAEYYKLGIPIQTREGTPLLTLQLYPAKDKKSTTSFLINHAGIRSQMIPLLEKLDSRGQTYGHLSARKGDNIGLKFYFDYGGNPYIRCQDGQTIFDVLNEIKGKIDPTTHQQMVDELKKKHREIAKEIFKKMPTITATTTFDEIKPFLFHKGHFVPIDSRNEDKDGKTLYMMAAEEGNRPLVLGLERLGANRYKKSTATEPKNAHEYAMVKGQPTAADTAIGLTYSLGFITGRYIAPQIFKPVRNVRRALGFG